MIEFLKKIWDNYVVIKIAQLDSYHQTNQFSYLFEFGTVLGPLWSNPIFRA